MLIEMLSKSRNYSVKLLLGKCVYFANVVDFSSSIKSDKAGMVIVSL